MVMIPAWTSMGKLTSLGDEQATLYESRCEPSTNPSDKTYSLQNLLFKTALEPGHVLASGLLAESTDCDTFDGTRRMTPITTVCCSKGEMYQAPLKEHHVCAYLEQVGWSVKFFEVACI